MNKPRHPGRQRRTARAALRALPTVLAALLAACTLYEPPTDEEIARNRAEMEARHARENAEMRPIVEAALASGDRVYTIRDRGSPPGRDVGRNLRIHGDDLCYFKYAQQRVSPAVNEGRRWHHYDAADFFAPHPLACIPLHAIRDVKPGDVRNNGEWTSPEFLGAARMALEDLRDELRWRSFTASPDEIQARRISSFFFTEQPAYFGFTPDADAVFVVFYPSVRAMVWRVTDGKELAGDPVLVRADDMEDARFRAAVSGAAATNGRYQLPDIATPFERTEERFPLRLGALTLNAATERNPETGSRKFEHVITIQADDPSASDRLLRGLWGRSSDAAISPADETRLLSWSQDATYIWNIETDALETVVQPGGAATWSPDGRWIAVANADRVNIVEAETGGRAASLRAEGGTERAAFAPNGQMLAIVSHARQDGARGYAIEVWTLSDS